MKNAPNESKLIEAINIFFVVSDKLKCCFFGEVNMGINGSQ